MVLLMEMCSLEPVEKRQRDDVLMLLPPAL